MWRGEGVECIQLLDTNIGVKSKGEGGKGGRSWSDTGTPHFVTFHEPRVHWKTQIHWGTPAGEPSKLTKPVICATVG